MSSAVAAVRRQPQTSTKSQIVNPAVDRHAYRRRRFWLVIALVAYLGATGLARVYAQNLVAQTSLQLSSKQNRLKELQLENEKLRVESVTLRSPARIERYAISRLGMVRPSQVHYITVEVPVPASRRSADAGRSTGRLAAGLVASK